MEHVTIRGCDIACETGGAGREAVLFLNGIAMTIGHWTPMAEAMGATHRWVCHDFRGQLMSGKPAGGYSLESHADDVKVLMDHLGIEKAHILGTSYGSEIGMIFACAYPDACLSLTVIDGVSELDAVLDFAVDSWKAAAAADPALFLKTIIPWNYSPAWLEANRDSLKAREDAMRRLPAEYFAAFMELCDAFLKIDITERIREISCPTLVLVGELDILKHLGFAEIIAANIPNSDLRIIPGAGHAVVLEQPAEVSRTILDWLAGL